MERWYGFLAKGLKPLYGYGRLDQAFEFAQRLSRARGMIYLTKMLTDEEAQELRHGGQHRGVLADAGTGGRGLGPVHEQVSR